MVKGIAIGVVLTLVVIAVGGFVALRTGMIPANADAPVNRMEYWAAHTSLRATIRREALKTDNPLPLNDSNLLAGVKLYAQNCAVCHGDSSGNATNIAKGLYQHAPQLANHGVEDDPDGVTYWKVSHGIRWTGMPSFSASLSDSQIWQLVLFLKHMDSLTPVAQQAWSKVSAER
jgi:thiosulfate dehydrogenase